MDGGNRRSREAVRNSIRTYGVKVMDPASLPLKRTKERESQDSVSRFSERSLHSEYRNREGSKILHRIPYGTLLAFILCLLGLLIFGIAIQRTVVLTNAMLLEVFNDSTPAVSVFGVVFIGLEVATGIVGGMILILGFLTTGDTRSKVYGGPTARVWGWTLCVVFIVLTTTLSFFWLLAFGMSCSLVLVIIMLRVECNSYTKFSSTQQCLNLSILNTFFPREEMGFQLCDNASIKKFCKDYVENVSHTHFAFIFSSMIIIMSQVVFLICLSANYTRIRAQAKFQELDEIRQLGTELHNSASRF